MAAELSIRDHFLTDSEVSALAACCRERVARGDFRAARIGRGSTLQQAAELRGDLTCWLQEPLFDAEKSLLAAVEKLRLELNRTLFLGLFEAELHYAWYPPGASYVRHLDQPHGSTQRIMSLAMYLNEDWDADAGGELRVYEADEGFRDIKPVAGRLMYFVTAGVEHSVLPATRDRYSVSGWFCGRG